MKIQLSHIDQAPAGLPIWQTIMDDLCNPPAHRVAKVLGISVRSVGRYHQHGHAPRAVLLALFWLTTWGRSAVDAKATNDARLMSQLAQSLAEERDRLQRQVQALERTVNVPSLSARLKSIESLWSAFFPRRNQSVVFL